MGNLFVGIFISGMILCTIKCLAKERKQGKSITCDGDCKSCGRQIIHR